MQLCSTGYPLSSSCWVRPHVPSSSSLLLCWLWAACLLHLFMLGFGSHWSSSASSHSSLFLLSSPHRCIPCSASFPLSSLWCFCPPPCHFCLYPLISTLCVSSFLPTASLSFLPSSSSLVPSSSSSLPFVIHIGVVVLQVVLGCSNPLPLILTSTLSLHKWNSQA